MNSFLLVAGNSFRSRWMVVVAGFFIMSVSGSIYAFAVYSGALKQSLGYNQKTLTTIGFFKDFGNIGIFAGLLADLCPAWVVLSVGVGFNTFGYLMIWMAVTHRIPKPSLWQMYLYITIGGNSVAFTHAGALVTCVKDFPLHRGMIVGLLKGFLGLSTAMLTLFYRAIYGDHPSAFILLITYMPFAVILAFMMFIRPLPMPKDGKIEDEAKVFYRLFMFEVLVAAYLMTVILIQHTVGVEKSVNGGFAGLLAILLCVPFGMVVLMEVQKLRKNRMPRDVEMLGIDDPAKTKQDSQQHEDHQEEETSTKDKLLLAKIQPRDSSEEEGDNPVHPEIHHQVEPQQQDNQILTPRRSILQKFRDALKTPAIGQDFTIWQALVHPDFWLLSVASTCGLGAGLMLIDNLGQIGASYGYDAEKTGTFVSLVSIWNCLGRVGCGFVSEFFLQRNGLARPFFYALALGLSAIGYLAIALDLAGALFVGSILIGLCFGAQWALLHIIVSEIFGLRYYGTLQSIIAMASPLGTYLLSVRVAGYLYDQEADHQRDAARGTAGAAAAPRGKDLACNGTVCYRKSLLIMCGVCGAGCLLMLFMTLRTRLFYKREVYEKLKAKRAEMELSKQKEKSERAERFAAASAAKPIG